MNGKYLKLIGLMIMSALLALAVACADDTAPEQPVQPGAAQPAMAPAQPSGSGPSAPMSPAQPLAPVPAPTLAPTSAAPAPTARPSGPARTTGTIPQPPAPAEKLEVVTTSNIVADWIREVGQDRVNVFPLLPVNADPHTFQPGARDIAKVADADLVFSIGLSLEAGWLSDVVENAARDHDAIIELGEYVDPIDFVEMVAHDDHDDHDDDHAEGMDHDEEEIELVGRLLVGDGETGMLSVIDLEHGDVEQGAFDMGSRAGRIYSTHSGRFAIAVASDANAVHVFDGGVYLEEHGDHFDLVEVPVRRMGLDLSGDKPSHLYVGGEWATVFYDGSGEIALLNEHELEEEGDEHVPPTLNTGAHHGAAVPLEGDLFAVTLQHPDYASSPADYRLPESVAVMNLDGDNLHQEDGCEKMHGDAGNGHMAVFGCVGGVLFVEAHDGDYEGGFIEAPAGSPEDFRLTSLWGYEGLDHFFALGSAVGLYVVEPEEGGMEQLIPASDDLRPINVSLSHDGELLLVVMSDGELRMYEAHDLDLLASASDIFAAPVETGFWARPHIVTAPGAIFATDSVGGEVLMLDDHDLEVVAHWDVAGNPTKLAFVGILGDAGDHPEAGHDDHDDAHDDDHDDAHDDDHDDAHDDDDDHDDGDAHAHDHGELDPHFWFDPLRVKQAVNRIAERLSAADPAGQDFYRFNAASYNGQLDDLHAWIAERVATLPDDRRVLVTSHDSFQYFAQRYGFEVAGAVIPGVTTEVEPSAQEIAELIETIEHEGVPAVFTETIISDRLAQRVAEETGAKLVPGLYTGSLSEPGGAAGTYLAMMRHNTTTIVEALR